MSKTQVKITTDDDIPKGRMNKPKGFGHWTAYTQSNEYKILEPEDREITDDELAKHNKPDDLWIGLMHENRICVFDITKFAEYHPGGFDILLGVGGKDATHEFRIAHAYVNTNMIAKFKKGYLVRSMFKSPNTLSPGMTILPPVRRPPPQIKPRWNWTEVDKIISVKFELLRPLIQGLNCISIIYTDADMFKLRIFQDIDYYYLYIKLNSCLIPNLDNIKLSDNSKEITLEFINNSDFMLSHLGGIIKDAVKPTITAVDDEILLPCTLTSMKDINHDCRELVFNWPTNCRIGIPLGHHVNISAVLKDNEIIGKPYTPICALSPSNTEITSYDKSTFTLMVKRYSQGQMSSYLHSLDIDSKINISLPFGQFKSPKWLITESMLSGMGPDTSSKHFNIETVVLLAAGSGITPIMRILVSILTTTKYKVRMIYFNRRESDMIYYEDFLAVREFYHDRFQIDHVLSQPDTEEWSGFKGRITDKLLSEILNNPKEARDEKEKQQSTSLFMFCGPSGFNKTCVQIMKIWSISSDRYWEFKG